jgi:thiazole synthase
MHATTMSVPPLTVGSFSLRSRLVTGTGKYPDHATMNAALEASGCSAVTVAVRRERLVDASGRSLLDALETDRYTILPNTAGCFSADDAIRVARLGRELLEQLGNAGSRWVKLEVLGDRTTLLPDPVGTLEACRELVKDGFEVLCYSSDDPIMAVRLRDAGATSVMPAGSPIGSGRGIANPSAIAIILELLKDPTHGGSPDYPVIVDAGVGTPSDITIAMELGADGVHIGQEDGAIYDVRSRIGADMIIGRSTHSLAQAKQALADGADYIGYGPLFPTPTKAGRLAIGLGDIAEMEREVGSRIPAFCIGGIKPDNLSEVLAAGARRCVVVSHLLLAADIVAETHTLRMAMIR